MGELIDVYNRNKEKTGKIIERKRDASLDKGEYIISVTCWIINKEGKILLTQRKLDKHNGGKWEATTGLILSGESSLEGIIRELNEEIGINVNQSDLVLIKEIIEERINVSFFRDIYLINKDIDLEDIKYNDGEVVSAKYITIDEFKMMLSNNEILEYLEYFVDLYTEIMFGRVSQNDKVESEY